MKGKILRNFVSEIDQFLKKFNQQNPILSESQKKEVSKYQKIYLLRDNEDTLSGHPPKKLWKGF